ncbi:hypothetical protein OAG51_03190, partial [Pirellulaceae bacterium]|nr:hypothetical protein [Pirellulaceae bacterium]
MLDFGRLLELVKDRLNHLRWISTLVADAGFAEGQTLAKSRDQMFLELKSYRKLKSINSKETEKELKAVIASRQTSTREVFGDDWWTGYSFHHIAVEIVDMVIKNHLERLIREILVEHRAKSDKDLQEEWYVNWLDHPEKFKPEWMLELKELFASITSEEFEWMRNWTKWILRLQDKLEFESSTAATLSIGMKGKPKKSRKNRKYSP